MRLIKYLIAIVIFILIASIIDLSQLWSSLSSLTLRSVCELLLVSVFLIGVSVYKWQIFLESFGERVRFWRLSCLYLLGYFVNLILPSFIGGDVARSHYLGKSVEPAHSYVSTFLERFTGLLALVVVGVVAAFLRPELGRDLWMALSVALIVSIGGVVALCSSKILSLLPVKRIRDKLEWIQKLVHIPLAKTGTVAATMGLSLVFQLLTIVNTAVACWAVGFYDFSWFALAVVVPLILLVSAVPITPNGLGVQEGAFTYLMQFAGASPEQGLAVALVLRAKSYLFGNNGNVCLV